MGAILLRSCKWGYVALTLLLFSFIVPATLDAALIRYEVISLGSGSYRFDYEISGVQVQLNQEIAIHFDPALYGTLSNGVAPGDFNLFVGQPNNPPGASGVYSIRALVNTPSLAGPFQLDAVFLGNGYPSAALPYEINQMDSQGNIIGDPLESGSASNIPEPAAMWLTGIGLLVGSAWWRKRRRS